MSFSACSREQYEFQLFTFPEEIPPHESGWQYQGKAVVSTGDSGSMFRKGTKKISIGIVDANDRTLLKDEYVVTAAGIKFKVVWDSMEMVSTQVIEHGSMTVDDEYSRRLSQSGEKIISVRTYQLQADGKHFDLVGNGH